jgi:hypothetical protein
VEEYIMTPNQMREEKKKQRTTTITSGNVAIFKSLDDVVHTLDRAINLMNPGRFFLQVDDAQVNIGHEELRQTPLHTVRAWVESESLRFEYQSNFKQESDLTDSLPGYINTGLGPTVDLEKKIMEPGNGPRDRGDEIYGSGPVKFIGIEEVLEKAYQEEPKEFQEQYPDIAQADHDGLNGGIDTGLRKKRGMCYIGYDHKNRTRSICTLRIYRGLQVFTLFFTFWGIST